MTRAAWVGVALAVSLLGGACVALGGCGASQPTPGEVADIAARITLCQAEGRDAGTYTAYDGCMRRLGLR